MLQNVVLFVHVAAAFMIIGLVLLQRGKGAEAGTGFGAGASGTVFGARGSANFLSHATGVLVAVFFVTSMTLTYLSTQSKAPTSLLDRPAAEQSAPAPSPAPATPPSELPDVQPSKDAPPGDAPHGDAPPSDAPQSNAPRNEAPQNGAPHDSTGESN